MSKQESKPEPEPGHTEIIGRACAGKTVLGAVMARYYAAFRKTEDEEKNRECN